MIKKIIVNEGLNTIEEDTIDRKYLKHYKRLDLKLLEDEGVM